MSPQDGDVIVYGLQISVDDSEGRALSIVELASGSVDSLATLTGASVTRGQRSVSGSVISCDG